jgi:hypothetical protein
VIYFFNFTVGQSKLLIYLKNKSSQCYCGNKYGSYGTAQSKGKTCNRTCTKSVNDICGGLFANSVYKINPIYTTTTTTSTPLEIDNFTDTTIISDSSETSELSGNSLVKLWSR